MAKEELNNILNAYDSLQEEATKSVEEPEQKEEDKKEEVEQAPTDTLS